MRRCKLISPTKLLLEHPIVSPVDECEYFLVGVNEYAKDQKERFTNGVLLGVVAGMSFCSVLIAIFDFVAKR